MNMDINKKYTLPRAIILAVCPLLLAVACDNYDGPGPDTPAEEVPLNFNASIEKTGTTQSRTIITPTTDFTGNSYSFGMSLTKSENGSEIFKGSSDMTATMERPNSSTQWNWYFTDNSDNATVTPAGPEGKALKVVAYYPPVLSATKDVYTDGIPFDFSSKTDLKQTDLLYNTSTIYPFVPSGDPVATIPLNFRHAYTWIVLNITKYVDKGPEFTLSSVSLDNLGGSWIKNQGAIDPETGLAKDGATAGPIGITVAPAAALSTTQVLTYEFLVPSFMDTKVSDGDIVLVLNVNGINELFTLDRIYLNRSDDGKSFGFRQGYKNTYDLVYNNSALSLSIQNWSSEVIDGDFGGNIVPPGNGDYKWMNLNQYYWPSATKPGDSWQTIYPPKPTYLATGVHPFEDYLTTVAYGGNGAYVPVNTPDPTKQPTDGLKITDDINVYKNEKAYPVIQITRNDISTVLVPWEDANGQLVAKELCRKYNGGGFHNWRLPRASELRTVLVLVSANGSNLSDLNFNQDANRNKPYWTGTEVNENEAWGMYIDYTGLTVTTKLVLSPYDKKMTASVRCVRDAS
ncbi:fimbrillin family protein [Bacteroides hominis]|uniref:fimbrillin family protein n=1 Tax=Bacteroides hominis TaxID=2763023 RepID=UPI0029494759|nr:fimbrillin family protein [Bacteroides hominis (ex Liu et al. 2022)]MDV6187485.1 fimbrillin family protein [Bacteroides hominis (ex Liu et al. 2022)]